MSTLPNQANISPSWKQEVNQRVAAHKDRKTVAAAEPLAETHHTASTRAAAAAARVAARYANAPSYSEILAAEARAAVRAAEAASKAALQAQAAAESVLAEIEAASSAEPAWGMSSPEAIPEADFDTRYTLREAEPEFTAPNPNSRPSEQDGFEIRWEPDLPARPAEIAAVHTNLGTETPENAPDNSFAPWREPSWTAQEGLGSDSAAAIEPPQPIHANLIEFPREIIATRKVRPRLAEGPLGTSGGQLSIFEVDPGSISTEPLMTELQPEGASAGASVPAWSGPEWSGIELDAQPRPEFAPQQDLSTPQSESAAIGAGVVLLAPLNRRLMAATVNLSLVTATFIAAALTAASHMKVLQSPRAIEVAAAIGLAVVAVLYHAFFYAFSKGTPGMAYAGISLCTFDGKKPTRAQRFSRLGAMLLSILPVGLGVMWAIFDEDHLSWHDRLSRTYLRRN